MTKFVSESRSNFTATEKEIRALVKNLLKDKIIGRTPPARHFGGIFEAMTKGAEKVLKAEELCILPLYLQRTMLV